LRRLAGDIAIVLALILFPALGVKAQMTPEEAFGEGKAAGAVENTEQIRGNLNDTKATEVLQGYSPTPPDNHSSYWGGGGTLLAPLVEGGSNKITECGGVGLESSDPSARMHCEAVDSLAKQPVNKPADLISITDPLIVTGNSIANNPEAIAGTIDGIYADCRTTTNTRPESVSLENCTEFSGAGTGSCKIGLEVVVRPDTVYQCKESLWKVEPGTCSYGHIIQASTQYNYQCSQMSRPQTYKCRKMPVPEVGEIRVPYPPFTHVSETPPNSVRTFTYNYRIDEIPEAFRLTRYEIDNYGQLWVNGVLVYQSQPRGSNYGDMRHGSIQYIEYCYMYQNVCDEWGGNCRRVCSQSNIIREFVNAGGEARGTYGDNSNWCCPGGVGVDITPYIHKGDNEITVVCMNAGGPGPCRITLDGSVWKKVLLGAPISSQCVEFEQRAN
jgi:hypothetical protein